MPATKSGDQRKVLLSQVWVKRQRAGSKNNKLFYPKISGIGEDS